MSNLTIDVRAVLSFFDEDRTVSRHSNAIKAMAGEEFMFALLIEYFSRSGLDAELLNQPCTTGRPSGPRLDGWVTVRKGDSKESPIFYQVEVKSWSAHGIGSGSRFIKPSASADDIATFKREIWATYWSKGRFIENGLNKVLSPMACPDPVAVVKPLACLWSAVHPTGDLLPFFSVQPNTQTPFPEVFVFSASSFLRGIEATEPTLQLRLPQLAERTRLLNTLFVTQDAQLHVE